MNEPLRSIVLGSVHAGRAQPYTRPGSVSAIDKRAVSDRVQIDTLGLVGDEQGDRRVHGGPDKAVHHYPFDHYPHWRGELGDLIAPGRAGAFGENLSSTGWTEDEVCLGDRIRIGEALFEVSQGRQPCWKLNDRFGVADMARRVQASGRTGWYYRVLQPGTLGAGDAMTLEARPFPQWTLRRLGALVFDRRLDPRELQRARAAADAVVAQAHRDPPAAGRVEDWGKRIDGRRPTRPHRSDDGVVPTGSVVPRALVVPDRSGVTVGARGDCRSRLALAGRRGYRLELSHAQEERRILSTQGGHIEALARQPLLQPLALDSLS